ncbi:hypothetical protein POL68_21790 [Stigmatella sp. ncwal1]|uniref:ATP-grasp domain-containing protein n=1 Tax=Stigmatella ashevillensis TaxID=2995309 RepID=A0ABT5DBV3_9BACT|nr:hypothetical protein [Stigmatella ashevillena]MDC0711116.1 hypothetical protein [Stigmatella ashevillena]
MKVFILSARNADFYSLKNISRQCDLFLIATPAQVRGMREDVRQHFQEIIEVREVLDRVSRVSTFDKSETAQAIRRRIQEGENFRIICNQEANLLVASELREEFGIPGPRPRQIEPFRNKLLMKSRLSSLSNHLPRYVDLEGVQDSLRSSPHAAYSLLREQLGSALILKPKSSVGSRGVYLVREWEEFESFLTNESEFIPSYEADEYIQGTLYECDSVVQRGQFLFSECSLYTCPNLEFQFGKNLGSLPLAPNNPEAIKLKEFSRQVLSNFDLPDSAFHMEIFLRPDGTPVFLEVAARVPGLASVPLYAIQHGVNMLDLEFRVQTGIQFDSDIKARAESCFYMVFPKKDGLITELCNPPVESPYTLDWKVKEGERTTRTTTNIEYAGLLVAHGTAQQVFQEFERTRSFDPIRTSQRS